METSSTLVIKVKYGNVLRRFNAQIADGELNLSMDGLRKKIQSLFNFALDFELMLTYIDEDGDVVNLVDDDDIRDVVKQALNPFRITVNVNAEKNGSQFSSSSESSTALRSPEVQQQMQNLHTGVSEILRTLPEPLREMLVKLSGDFASKASSSAPGVTELVDNLSKVGLSYLDQLSESQTRAQSSMQSGVPGSTDAKESRDSEMFKADPAATLNAIPNLRSELSSKNSESLEKLKPEAARANLSFDLSAVAAALDCQNMNIAQPSNDSLLNPGVFNRSVGKKEKVKKIVDTTRVPPAANNVGKRGKSCIPSYLQSVANNIATEEEVNDPSKPKLGPNQANVDVSDPKTREYDDVRGRSALPNNLGKSPDSICAPSLINECPFSGITVGNISDSPPHPAPEGISFRRIISQKDDCLPVIHRGICCDGCGIYPITGPRFKSKVKLDYDLCSTCFEEMGNDTDYIQMDAPMVYRSHVSFKGLHDAHAKNRGPAVPQVYRGCKIKPVATKLDSRFVQDVNIVDGTLMAPFIPFTKIWRMRNNGTVGWLQGTQLVWIGGDKFSNELSVEVKIPEGGLWMDQELDVMVDFISPELPGRYISYWRMATPSGEKFGQRVWVLIQVDDSMKETPRESIRNLNLNLPPASSCLTGLEFINVDPEPIVEGSLPDPYNFKKMVELAQPTNEQELKFPINESLLAGNGASTSEPSSTSLSVSYPIIDLSDVSSALLSVPPVLYQLPQPTQSVVPVASELEPAVGLPEKQVEEKLVRELEEMGFKQVDLNKEILRKNGYNLEQAVADLCGGTEWDPILENLNEMGFHDREMNKMLLKKYNGSIKRVVMDLIAGERT